LAFKVKRRPKEKVELVSLIDMVFILLAFFLVTSYVIHMPLEERSVAVPTPSNDLGRAQIVIQFVDEERIFWIDESVASIVEEVEENFGYFSPERIKNRIFSELTDRNIFSSIQIEEKLEQLRSRADENPYAQFFVLIRCPNALPYYKVVNLITQLTETTYRNIKYGCVGGTLQEIQQCRRIYTVVEEDSQGRRRKNIRIDL